MRYLEASSFNTQRDSRKEKSFFNHWRIDNPYKPLLRGTDEIQIFNLKKLIDSIIPNRIEEMFTTT